MARLHEYSPNSDKSGYYLYGRSPESNTTFQVGRAATQLFDWMDLSVGQRIPDDLLWKLFDANLLWTGGRDTATDDAALVEYLQQSAGQFELTDAQASRLRQFIQEYDGLDVSKVRKLEPLVSGVSYERTDESVTRWVDRNPLSGIVEQYFPRTEIPDSTRRILNEHGVDPSQVESLKQFPAPVVKSIPDIVTGFFDVEALRVDDQYVYYGLKDAEMWIETCMVWTDWELMDYRGNPAFDIDFEAGFVIDHDNWEPGSSILGLVHLKDGVPTTCQFTVEDDDYAEDEFVEEYSVEFRDYLYDLLHYQFREATYSYAGPDPRWDR